jgi:hypothetical protein
LVSAKQEINHIPKRGINKIGFTQKKFIAETSASLSLFDILMKNKIISAKLTSYETV